MKICYLCADPGIPILGRKGCSTHVRETCLILSRMGHQVKVLCSNVEGDASLAADLDIIPIEPFRSRKLGFDLRHMLLDRRLWRTMRSVVHDWQPDAIYERYSLYSRTGGKAARRFGLPRLLELNAFLTQEQSTRIKLPWLARRVERSIIRSARRVIVVSEPLRREVNELGVPFDAIAKMPMAVNLDQFNPSHDGSAVRKSHELEGRFIIGYVGTLSGWHGIKLLYDMARRMIELDAPPFAFLIVGGEGRKLEQHRLMAREKGLDDAIRFVGSVPHDDVPEHIRAMDAAIVPDTTYWSSPAKLFEYQACGVPVLAPSYPAIHEVLDHGVEGFIYPAADTDKMAESALNLMRDPDACLRMGRAAHRRAERDHSWRTNGDKIIDLFRKAQD